MRSHRWRSVQSGLPESAHGCPELVKHALLVEANGMCRNRHNSVGCLSSHDSRVSSLSKLNQVKPVTATTARYFARALQKGGDQCFQYNNNNCKDQC